MHMQGCLDSRRLLGDGTIIVSDSVTIRRSFHLAVVVRISASVSRYRLPSGHAYHHRLGAVSHSQVALTQQVINAVTTAALG